MRYVKLSAISSLISITILLSGCGVMRGVGGALSDFDNQNEGIVGDIAGVAGTVYTTVGCMGTGASSDECKEEKKKK